MFDSWFPKSKDHLPLTWWKQIPVYLAGVVAVMGACSMVVYALMGAIAGSGWMNHLVFSVDRAFPGWHVWTPFTYVLVNAPSLWTLLGCYLLWSFGEAVERHLGRRSFVALLALLVVSSPALITLLHLAGVPDLACAGMMQLEFGVFIAFATLYPRSKISLIILTIDAWVLAAVFVGINALQCLAVRDWVSLLLLSTNVGIAYAFIRREKGELNWPKFSESPARKPTPPNPQKARKSKNSPASLTTDEILDKISREGIHSLTAEERRILERASKEMKRRE